MTKHSIDRRKWLRSMGVGAFLGPLGLVTTGCGRPVATNSLGMQFIQIPRGSFTMGAPESEAGQAFTETPHRVTLTSSYLLGVHEVTQQQYLEVMGENPSRRKSPPSPVDSVSWFDVTEFCRRLAGRPGEKDAGYDYRLPTEAEWEYACRAKSDTPHSITSLASDDLLDYAWISENSEGVIQPAGQKLPNGYGVYDMHGNVAEWCSDWMANYPKGSVTNPRGPREGVKRVCRGGSYRSKPEDCRSASRWGYEPEVRSPHVGFRIVRTPRVEVNTPTRSTTANSASSRSWIVDLGVGLRIRFMV
jgi:formylglycine-generating enzyme required for sulfatase activity